MSVRTYVEWLALKGEVQMLREENERLREALEWMADAERAEGMDPRDWAVEAHERAQSAMEAA